MKLPPYFSIVVPTKNRPNVLRRALDSLAAQTFADFEVIIVDDGSSDGHLESTRTLLNSFDQRFHLLARSSQERRHGPNVARNVGMAAAQGEYIGFLDDDDFWCDRQHLQTAKDALDARPADVYVADQEARRGEEVIVSQWLPFASRVVAKRSQVPRTDVFELVQRDLLVPEGIGFAHVNITLLKRQLADEVGGFWEELPYEEDLDFFLRWVDRVNLILYRPKVVAVNSVRHSSESQGASSLESQSKQLFRILACQHAERCCHSRSVKRYIRLLHGGVLKTMAKQDYDNLRYSSASEYARRAVAVQPSFRWCCIAALLSIRSLFSAFGAS